MNAFFLKHPHLFSYYGVVLVFLGLFSITYFFKNARPLRAVLGVSLILIPIVYFFLILEAHLVNIPFTDDWNLLETVQKFQQERDFVEAAKILFEQVNQHRFAFERLVMLTMAALTGTVNLEALILLGDSFMLGIAALFFLAFRREGISWYYFIPVPFVLFNLVYFENAFWGIAAIQNTPLLFFAMLSAYAVGRGDKNGLILGGGTALLVTFVSGTGMLAWIVGGIILGFQKRFRALVLWGALAAATIAFYFLFDYHFIEAARGVKVWDHPIFNGLLLLGFWGNALFLDVPHPLYPAFYPDMVACVVLGLGIGLVFVAWALKYFIVQKLQWSYWLVLAAFLFGMGTGAMFMLSRPVSEFFMYGGSIFSRRYMIFGVVLLATAYVAVVILVRRVRYGQPIVLSLGLAGFVLLNFVSYFTSIQPLRKQHDELQLDAYYWKHYTTFLTAGDNFGDIPFWNHPTRMKELVSAVEASGISQLAGSDRLPDPARIRAAVQRSTKGIEGTFTAKMTYRNGPDNLPLEYVHFFSDSPADSEVLLLVSEKYVIPLPALPQPRMWLDFLRDRTYYSTRMHYGLFRTKIPEGTYRVWLGVPSGSTWEYQDTRKRLTFSGDGKTKK